MEAFGIAYNVGAVGELAARCTLFVHIVVLARRICARLGVVAEVIPGGVGGEVGIPFVYQTAGGIHFARKELGKRIEAAFARPVYVDYGVYAFPVPEFLYLHCVGGVEDYYYLFEVVVCYLQKLPLAVGEHEVVLICVAFGCRRLRLRAALAFAGRGSVLRKGNVRLGIGFAEKVGAGLFARYPARVAAFAARPGEYDDSRVVIHAERALYLAVEVGHFAAHRRALNVVEVL